MFKKRESVDVLDIPELHRRKLIKLPEQEKQEKTTITKDGFFDLSQNTPVNTTTEVKQDSAGLLSDFASIGASEQPKQQISEEKSEDNVKDLKWRIENLEYKLEQLIERVDSINR